MAVLGIDLGTTNSCVAVLRGGKAEVIPNGEGQRLTPSVVAIGTGSERLIGRSAKRQAIVNPANTLYSLKRFVGRSFASPEIEAMLDRVPFKLVEGGRKEVHFDIGGQVVSPEQVSAMILEKLRTETEEALDEACERCVITVPAYFDDRQRIATKQAGQIAGLDVMRIVNEPTAAAFAYGLRRHRDQVIAVFDLGGGTFDISILEQRALDFRVLATSGNTFLGGDDFDQIIVDWLADQYERAAGSELPNEPTVLQRFKQAAEEAKKDLSTSTSTQVQIPFVTAGPSGPVHLDVELTRDVFDRLVGPLVERTVDPCNVALEDAGLDAEDIDVVVLIGGQTRSPIVRDQVERLFGRAPVREINPDEAVAMGASIAAGMAAGELEEVEEFSFTDVAPLSLGIEKRGGAFSRIIKRNTPIPCTAKRIFTTTEDHQMLIRVHVLQGEREVALENRTLGIFGLGDFKPGPKGVPKIEISFEVDGEGIVHVSALDLATGAQESRSLTSAREGLSDSEVERLVKAAEASRADDREVQERIALRNSVLDLLYVARGVLDDEQRPLEGAVATDLRRAVDELDAALADDLDRAELEREHDRLLGLLESLG